MSGTIFAFATRVSDHEKIDFAVFSVNVENDALILMSDQMSTTLKPVTIRYPIIPPTKFPMFLKRSPSTVISVPVDKSFKREVF